MSTPEQTATDLATDLDRGGGVSNVATVLGELAEDPGLSGTGLARLAALFPGATARRLGYLLERVDADVELEPLRMLVARRPLSRPALLTRTARDVVGSTRTGACLRTVTWSPPMR